MYRKNHSNSYRATKIKIMETKNAKTTDKLKVGKTKNEVVKKKISKAMRAAEKYRGSVEILDMEALFKPVY